MKNLLASYLVAKASAAEKDHMMEMRADLETPAPILIAATYDIGDGATCTNDDVKKEVLAVSQAKGAYDKRVALTATSIALTKALADKATKDKEVTAKNALAKAALAADNVEQIKEYDLKTSWIVTYRAWTSAKAAEAAQAQAILDATKLKNDADTKRLEIKASLAAATAQFTRNDAENKAWLLTNDKGVADLIVADNAKLAQAKIDNDSEVGKLLALWNTWQYALVNHSYLEAKLALVKKDFDALTLDVGGSAAGSKKAWDDKVKELILANAAPFQQYALDFTALNAKLVLAKAPFKAWLALDGTSPNYIDSSYEAEDNFTCQAAAGTVGTLKTHPVQTLDLTQCKAACSALQPWTMDAAYPTHPKEVTATDSTEGVKTCTGVQYLSTGTKCTMLYGAQVEKSASAPANTTCSRRKKSQQVIIKNFTDKWAAAKTELAKCDTYWLTAYGTKSGPLMKAYDIKKQQLAKVTAAQTLLKDTTIGLTNGAGSAKLEFDTKALYTALKDGAYKTKTSEYVALVASIAGNTEKLALNKYRGAVMASEVTADKAMEDQQKAELAAIVKTIGYNGTTDKLLDAAYAPTGLVLPGSGLKQAEINAKALQTCPGNVASCSGKELTFAAETLATSKAEIAAEDLYEKQIAAAKATAGASLVTTHLSALNVLLAASQAFVAVKGTDGAVADGALTDAIAKEAAHQKAIAGDLAALAVAEKAKLAKIVLCEASQYNVYMKTMSDAVSARKEAIKKIVALLDARAKPAKGAAGWRCEKSLSNGTFRPARGEKTCGDGLCCGAAKIVPFSAQKNVVMTIETCQTKTDTTFAYKAPRMPMAIKFTDATSVPFKCISGAQKLVTAASALAAAAYMMA